MSHPCRDLPDTPGRDGVVDHAPRRDDVDARRMPPVELEELWCVDDEDTGLTWLVSDSGGRLAGEAVELMEER